MNVLDLFSGIGGFSLGLERAGMRTVAFCEIDPYCQAVLRKHWPDVPVYGDVRELTAATLGLAKGNGCGAGRQGRLDPTGAREQQPDRPLQIDVICGGFPCQDLSVAGKGAGITGERSGLWSEYARIIGEVRPRYVIVENVAALLGRGLATVLGDLAALGFDAEWHCIPASAVGAPHRRDRVWIIAHAECDELRHQPGRGNGTCGADAAVAGDYGTQGDVADADQPRLEGWLRAELRQRASECAAGTDSAFPDAESLRRKEQFRRASRGYVSSDGLAEGQSDADWWLVEPAMGELVDGLSGGLVRFEGRVAKGVPDRVNKLRALGNAVVPQKIPELIGRAIMSAALEPKS